MPLPDRPVANTTIDSEWGQAVHDWTFAPKGCELTTATTTTVSTTPGGVNLDVATEDPGGFLDAINDRAVVPSGGDGLYFIILKLDSVNGTAGDFTRAYIYINGTAYASAIEENAGGVHIAVTVPALLPLTAGDIIRVYGQLRGSGTHPTVRTESLRMIRVGNEYGA